MVEVDFDMALRTALITDLPEATIRYLGVAAVGASGLEVLQILMQPVLGAKRHSTT